MRYIPLIAIAFLALTSACSIKSERTVVERPVAAPSTAVVYSEPAPATTVYVAP
jgi:hypothetical protein